MSVIACRITETGYQLAADSITVRGHTQTRENNTGLSKLVEVNGLVIGSVGTAQECSLFYLFAKTRRPATASEEGLLEFLSEFADWKKKKTDSGEIENSYLIGFEGKVFSVEEWFIEQVEKHEAIGAGMDFALAALHLGHDARTAVATAIELSIYCEAPIQVVEK